MSFRCGVARRDILPAKPMFLVGYPHVARISTGVHDPIFASAAYFSDGSREILTLSLDLCYLMPQTVRAWREAIRAATGIPASHILVSPTHTHSAPQTAEILMWRGDPVVPRPDPDYMDLVARRVLAAAMEARASAVDAELAVTRAEARGVGRNRIARDGPMDYEVGILFARRKADGAPLAALTVYGMHPTVLHEDSTRISSDFPHFARRQIEESLPGSMVVYHNGPCGNLSPRYEVRVVRRGHCVRGPVVLFESAHEAVGAKDGEVQGVVVGDRELRRHSSYPTRQRAPTQPGRSFAPTAWGRTRCPWHEVLTRSRGGGPHATASPTLACRASDAAAS
ncbi:MAG: hypothetical protein HUU04_11665 [Verrucomicrobiae bacterium]|nr:hypothetical protein [Verrucomicrobiae bacterium]